MLLPCDVWRRTSLPAFHGEASACWRTRHTSETRAHKCAELSGRYKCHQWRKKENIRAVSLRSCYNPLSDLCICWVSCHMCYDRTGIRKYPHFSNILMLLLKNPHAHLSNSQNRKNIYLLNSNASNFNVKWGKLWNPYSKHILNTRVCDILYILILDPVVCKPW